MSVIAGINEICFDACINAAETTLMQTPPDFNQLLQLLDKTPRMQEAPDQTPSLTITSPNSAPQENAGDVLGRVTCLQTVQDISPEESLSP